MATKKQPEPQKNDRCPYCNEPCWSRALHLMFCPATNPELPAEELKADEDRVAKLTFEMGSK